ncbi:hypothetical protein OKW22_000796 [Bacilli bacterium PM5-3]|nr:hypothetical protein [Bacilli bacterium PM5-3]MDH6603632.1 hypothetical protein [Bacilli bacterium PM5-9]
MKKTDGYFKAMNVPIIVDDKKIKLGTNSISFSKLYDINESYITDYAAIFNPAVIVTCGLVGGVLSLLLFKTFSLYLVTIGAFIGSIYVFYIYPKKVVKDNPDEYIKIIDFIYHDTHDSVVVKANADLGLNKVNLPKKGMMQKRVLGRYLSRLKKSRKYLISQFESQKELNYSVLEEKYSTVARDRYGINSTLGLKSIKALCEAYDNAAGKYIKLGFRLARFSFGLIIAIIIYLVLSGNMFDYQSFF